MINVYVCESLQYLFVPLHTIPLFPTTYAYVKYYFAASRGRQNMSSTAHETVVKYVKREIASQNNRYHTMMMTVM